MWTFTRPTPSTGGRFKNSAGPPPREPGSWTRGSDVRVSSKRRHGGRRGVTSGSSGSGRERRQPESSSQAGDGDPFPSSSHILLVSPFRPPLFLLRPSSLASTLARTRDSRATAPLSLPRLRDVRSIGSRESPARLCSPALCVRGSALLSMKPEIIYPRAIRPSFYRTRSSQTPAAGGYDRSEHACG